MQQTNKIIGESFFGKLPKDAVLLETDFVRLDKSVIWKLSELFWKYYSLWEKTYNENFEASLPSGISESHKPEFIHACAERFILLANKLQKQNKLSEIVYVYEQGPGTGIFAKGFLDEVKKEAPGIYANLVYILSDSSQEILQTCFEFLKGHKNHIKLYMQDAFEHTRKFDGKIIYARHSNLWDGWPCRYIQLRKSGLGEVYVRSVVEKRFEEFVNTINKEGLEFSISNTPTLWKEFFRSIKLQTRTIPFSAIDLLQNVYLQRLQEKSTCYAGVNTLLSEGIINNLSFLNRLIDWKRNGYIEIVDIISQESRRILPKKYDGSIGYIIDGDLIAHWCTIANKQFSFKKIRKLNTMLTITNKKNVEGMVRDASLEVFPSKDLLGDIQFLPKNTTLAVTCTSKLGIGYTIDNTIALRSKGYNAYPHLPARLMKDKREIAGVIQTLSENGIKEIFVAAGNPEKPLGPYGSAMELLLEMKNKKFPFQKVAVAGYPEGHPQISEDLLLQALQEKQAFAQKNQIDMRIVTQFCFDADSIVQWAMQMKESGIMLPIVLGVAGPYSSAKLLEFAIKCGVGTSLQFLKNKKQFPIQYNPEKLLHAIVDHPEFNKTHIVGFHFYTFNNIAGFTKWQGKFLAEISVAKE